MRATPYSAILGDVCDLMGWDADNLDARQFDAVRRAVSSALARIWDNYWWADLLDCKERTFALAYSSTATYAAGDFVWLAGPAKYYQSLQSTTGNAPSTLSGETWTTNSQYWAEATEEPGASWWDATISYVVGDRVMWRENGLVYQCIVAGAGNLPSGAEWGRVIPFDGYVDLLDPAFTALGRVRAVYDSNPNVNAGAARLPWSRSPRGVEVFTERSTVWVEGLVRPHVLTGSAYDSAAAYTAATDVSGATSTPATMTDTSGDGYPGIVSLRARTLHTANQMAYLFFVATEGDGGGGWFRFTVSSSAADDGVDVLKPDNVSVADPGRWVRV